jgi:hypothetical protein
MGTDKTNLDSTTGQSEEVSQSTTETTPDDIQKLLATLQKERARAENLEKQFKDARKREEEQRLILEKHKNVDPDKYQKLLEEAKRKEEQELEQKRAYDELKQRHMANEQKALAEANKWEEMWRTEKIENAIRNSFFENGGRKPAIIENTEVSIEDIHPVEVVINQMRGRVKIVDGRVCVVDRVGSIEYTEGRPKTLSEKIQELKQGSLGTLFEPINDSKGGGMTPQTASVGGKQVKVYTRKQVQSGQVPMAELAAGTAIIQG